MSSRICLAVGMVIVATGCRHAAVSPPAAGARAAPEAGCYQVESERFVFHSDPWINLHHFLYQWASASAERKPGDTRPPVEVPEIEHGRGLAEGESQAWERAVAYYHERLIGSDLLDDRDLIGLRGQLAALACTTTGAKGIDPEL